MAVVINTNYSANIASNNLASSNAMLQKSLNRLSSGSKIINPSDDAGGLAVSMKLSAAATRSGAVATNISNSVSFLQTQDGGLKVAGKILDRISELKTLQSDPTKSDSDKGNYETEFSALQSQLTSIADEKFNGVALFGSSSLSVQVTEGGANSVSLAGRDLSGNSTVSAVSTASGATALEDLDLTKVISAIEAVATMRSANGAEQSRLGFASELITVNKANLEAANSRITDVDVAEESTQLARWNTLVQAGTAMLAQANGSSQTALRLLQ